MIYYNLKITKSHIEKYNNKEYDNISNAIYNIHEIFPINLGTLEFCLLKMVID